MDLSDKIKKHIETYIGKKNKNCLPLFDELNKSFNQKEIACAYNYILENYTDKIFLDTVIREINKKKYFDNFSSLINFIDKYKSENDYNNIIVLAIKVLGRYKNPKAMDTLIACLNNKNLNYKIKLASADALGTIGNKFAFDSLQNIATDSTEKSTYVKESAIHALGMLRDERAIDVFDTIFNSNNIFQEKFSFLKESVIEALSKFDISREKKAHDIIIKSLHDNNPKVRITTIETIMNSDLNDKYKLIYERLNNDCDIEVKRNALIALYNISDSSILKEVINGNFEEEIKNTAKEILIDQGE